MAVTGSPTRDRIDGSQVNRKRGNRIRRGLTHWKPWERDNGRGSVVESITEVLTYRITGTHEARNTLHDGPLGFTRMVTLPTVEPVETRTVQRGGKRIHKSPQTLNMGAVSTLYGATEIVERRVKAEGKEPKPIDVQNIRIRNPKGLKNKHSKDAPKMAVCDGATKTVSSEGWKLKRIELHRIGVTKYSDAVAVCGHPDGYSKSIVLRRVKSEQDAIAQLAIIHRINV